MASRRKTPIPPQPETASEPPSWLAPALSNARRLTQTLDRTQRLGSQCASLMLQSLDRYEQGGRPGGLAEPVPYERLRADDKVVPLDVPWQTGGAYADEPVTGEGPAGAIDELEPAS